MAQPRPSLTLILDLDERLDSEDVRLEIDRCYSYVGSTLVRTHPACDGEPQNIMRFLVKLGTRRYLRAEDEGADELWNDVMERWFYNELYKVSNNMLIYNRRQREVGNPQLVFDWIDVELQNGQLHALLHCDNVSGIRPETSELLTQLRAAYNEGALGEDVVRAYLPAPASYEEQKAAGHHRLFPDLKREKRGNVGGPITTWFTRYRRKLGIGGTDGEEESSVVFHCFRYTVINHLETQARANLRLIQKVVGHRLKAGDIGIPERCSGKHPTATLRDEVIAVLPWVPLPSF